MTNNRLIVLHTKNIEEHIEKHYEIESNKNYFLQQLDISEEFYEDRFFPCVFLQKQTELKNLLLDEYGIHESIDDFSYLKNRTFVSFFRENSVDVPRCFKHTNSVSTQYPPFSYNNLYLQISANGKNDDLSEILDRRCIFLRVSNIMW